MNYSYQSLKEKQKQITSVSSKVKYRIKEWTTYAGILLSIAAVLVCVFAIAGAVRGMVDSAPDVKQIDFISKGIASTIYDNEGNEMQELGAENLEQEYVSISKISDHVKNAFVAIEDRKFYQHQGVDMQGILRAVYDGMTKENNKMDKDMTITQQLIQNQMTDGENEKDFLNRISRKIKEQYLAIALEDELDKEKILEYYLNTINLGEKLLGVQAASKRYFDKDVSELTISEAAVLAAVKAEPSKYNPVMQPADNMERRKLVLKAMLDASYISEDEYEDALGDDVYTRIMSVSKMKSSNKVTTSSYYTDAVVEQVISDLKEKLGYTQTQAYAVLYRRGVKIYSCQDSELQKVCDTVINKDSYYPASVKSRLSYSLLVKSHHREKEYTEIDLKNYFLNAKKEKIGLYFYETSQAKKYTKIFRKAMQKKGDKIISEKFQLVKQPQSSFVLMDQHNGQVLALVGGRGSRNANRAYNRATEVTREPGSVFQILSAYLPALDTCGMTLGTIQDDAEYKYPGTETAVPDGGNPLAYRGLMTLRDAIIQERNVPAVKTFQKVTPQTGYAYLKNMGFSTITEQKKMEDGTTRSDVQLPMCLGELADGVTNMELTAAYASIANGGRYQRPALYSKIVDRNGNTLLENETQKKQIMKESTAWLLTNVMCDNVESKITKHVDKWENEIAAAGIEGDNAGKTDFWFEGFTPYYTAGIWSGTDESENKVEGGYQIKIWNDIMEQIHHLKEKKKKQFVKPSGIIKVQICSKSGKLAVDGLCNQAKGGSCTQWEYFVKGTQPEQTCDCHIRYAFCKKSKQLANEKCFASGVYHQVLLKKEEESQTEDTPNLVQKEKVKEKCSLH